MTSAADYTRKAQRLPDEKKMPLFFKVFYIMFTVGGLFAGVCLPDDPCI